ncbi:MAG: M48 family metalloprotease [Pseudomonadota bacterium]
MTIRLLTLFLLVSILLTPAFAQAQGRIIIRDAEIEGTIKAWAKPIIEAAGLQPSDVKIILVQNEAVNAFVAGGPNIFIHSGLIEKANTPSELLGVIAHEIGHITGGHITRTAAVANRLSYEVLAATILGGAAAILSGEPGAMAAASAAAQATAMNQFLIHSRTQESSADQAAISYMQQAHIPTAGFVSFLRSLADQELLPTSQQSAYMRTHPVTRERMENVQRRVEASPAVATSSDKDETYRLLRAKLAGFTKPQQIDWIYPPKDQSVPAQYARAIAAYRQQKVAASLKIMDDLLAAQPQNPYFHEMKGQMLMDFARVRDAQGSYAKAVALAPDQPLIRITYAQALMEADVTNKAAQRQAIEELKRALRTEDRMPRLHRLLATAYGRIGDDGMVSLHLAEEALLQKRTDDAIGQSNRAIAKLPRGSAGSLKAQDILALAEQMKKD